jgi:ADP-heptose:LPS heptosyltransferase
MKRILVINPFGIGDVIFSMPLVEALKKAFPEASIGFLCNERTQSLVAMNPFIAKTFVFCRDDFRAFWKKSPVLFFKELWKLLSLIRRERYETLFDLSLAREYSFWAMLIGIKKRIGFDYKGRGIFLSRKKKILSYSGGHVSDIQLELLELAGVAQGGAKPSFQLEKERQSPGASHQSRILAIAPGGGKTWGANAIFKQWDPQRFAESANLFLRTHAHKVVVLGDESERPLLEKTAALIRAQAEIFCGQPLSKVCALLSEADILLCNDGGLLHLANALGVKTVSIFGPVDEKVYGPYPNGTPHQVLTQDVPCRPCYQNFHFPPCPHQRQCLEKLGIEKVVAALEKIA